MKIYGFQRPMQVGINTGAQARVAGHAMVGLLLGMFIIGGMEACVLAKGGSSSTLPSSAFFISGSAEANKLHLIALTQETHMKGCHKGPACEDAYYIRGLVALFENRADAIAVFQELHTAMPDSRYDLATQGWLNLLQDFTLSSVSNQALRAQLRQEVLHTLFGQSDLATVRSVQAHDAPAVELAR